MLKVTGAFLAALILAIPVIAVADGIDGNWSGAVSTGNGDLPVGFVFKADGTTLNGSMIAPDGSPSPIANGKIDGKNVTFAVDLNFSGTVFSLAYTGVLDGQQLKLSTEYQGQIIEFVVKKVQ
jgi:hypothetical protein